MSGDSQRRWETAVLPPVNTCVKCSVGTAIFLFRQFTLTSSLSCSGACYIASGDLQAVGQTAHRRRLPCLPCLSVAWWLLGHLWEFSHISASRAWHLCGTRDPCRMKGWPWPLCIFTPIGNLSQVREVGETGADCSLQKTGNKRKAAQGRSLEFPGMPSEFPESLWVKLSVPWLLVSLWN